MTNCLAIMAMTFSEAKRVTTSFTGKRATIPRWWRKDQLFGQAGNDTYILDSTIDTISEYVNEGTDTVQSSVSFTLAKT